MRGGVKVVYKVEKEVNLKRWNPGRRGKAGRGGRKGGKRRARKWG